MLNRNNTRFWAQENPRLLSEAKFQEKCGFNVWVGIIGTRIIGPILFDGPLTGQRYLQFLENDIQNNFNDLPENIRENMFFQQDGAGPHNANIVRQYLSDTYGQRWIGTNGPIRWPDRSPDLTPIDFYLWGHIESKVNSKRPTSLEDLRDRVERDIPAHELINVMRCTINRISLCIREHGQHFEHIIGH
ncbi:hypothetical protein JTB14_016021 [Gonioctena quinquepunctata]|nr:hypothetical protein JTB14_016021 [Gonioctena quinquepunctata]